MCVDFCLTNISMTEEFLDGSSIIVVVGYGVSFYLLALVLRTISISVAYAHWSGLGIVLVAFVGGYFINRFQTWPEFLGWP